MGNFTLAITSGHALKKVWILWYFANYIFQLGMVHMHSNILLWERLQYIVNYVLEIPKENLQICQKYSWNVFIKQLQILNCKCALTIPY